MHHSSDHRRLGRRVFLPSVLVALATSAAFAVTGAVAAGIGPSATGSGHFTAGGALRTFSFNAITQPDGTVTGNAQVNNRGVPGTIAGTDQLSVDCLQVVGNTAYVSGTITDSSVPSLVGDSGVFGVQDNGQGATSPPDQISIEYLYSPAPQLCMVVHPAPNDQIDGGNVQIH
jgi:hypothetical protein